VVIRELDISEEGINKTKTDKKQKPSMAQTSLSLKGTV
jgi:hypothetical protein